jgi:hypothetical protein
MSSQRIVCALVLSQTVMSSAGSSALTDSSDAGVGHEHQAALRKDAIDESEAARPFVARLERSKCGGSR